MRHRSPPQLDVTGPARVTLLAEGRRFSGRAVNSSGYSLQLVLEEHVAPGDLLMVQWEDTDVLGEACSCEQTEEGFAVAMKVEHALVGTAELARLASRLLDESCPRITS